MKQTRLTPVVLAFIFGACIGGLTAVTVIREAVPLRDHVWAIGLAVASGVPIFFILLFWYRSLLKSLRMVLGEKGGGVVSSILSFQMVAMTVIFLVVLTIFFAAIA